MIKLWKLILAEFIFADLYKIAELHFLHICKNSEIVNSAQNLPIIRKNKSSIKFCQEDFLIVVSPFTISIFCAIFFLNIPFGNKKMNNSFKRNIF